MHSAYFHFLLSDLLVTNRSVWMLHNFPALITQASTTLLPWYILQVQPLLFYVMYITSKYCRFTVKSFTHGGKIRQRLIIFLVYINESNMHIIYFVLVHSQYLVNHRYHSNLKITMQMLIHDKCLSVENLECLRNVCIVHTIPGGASQVWERTHARPEKHVKGGVFLKTTRNACDAFRGAKSPFFRKRGVSNFSGVAIRVMFSVL